MNKKATITILSIIAGIALVLGLLYYYQNQGYIKIFPTAEDRQNKKLLTIDRDKFFAPEGLTADKFEAKIRELEAQKQAVLENPQDAQAWFVFGHSLEFLNDHEAAVAVWEKTYELQPLNFVVTVNLANTYQYFLKDFARAEFYYKKTIEIQPGSTAAYQGLIDLYSFNLKEKQSELEPTVELAARKDPSNAGKYYATYTEFLARFGDISIAKTYLAKVKSLDITAYNDLVEAYPELK